ncbi:MAG: hypothetical protein K0Q74_1458 [Gammaproteobacteria bacterium]|nr:hypothetical protein [Gammaproteobacteria bacterium]
MNAESRSPFCEAGSKKAQIECWRREIEAEALVASATNKDAVPNRMSG